MDYNLPRKHSPEPLTLRAETFGVWSPDKIRFAYSDESGGGVIRIVLEWSGIGIFHPCKECEWDNNECENVEKRMSRGEFHILLM